MSKKQVRHIEQVKSANRADQLRFLAELRGETTAEEAARTISSTIES